MGGRVASSTFIPLDDFLNRFEFSAALQRNMVVVQSPRSQPGLEGTGAPLMSLNGQDGTAVAEATSSPRGQDAILPLSLKPPPSPDPAPPTAPQASPSLPLPCLKPPTTSVFAKGSPEAIRSLVRPESVPPDFDETLAAFTREGFRVLALAQGDVTEVRLSHLHCITDWYTMSHRLVYNVSSAAGKSISATLKWISLRISSSLCFPQPETDPSRAAGPLEHGRH